MPTGRVTPRLIPGRGRLPNRAIIPITGVPLTAPQPRLSPAPLSPRHRRVRAAVTAPRHRHDRAAATAPRHRRVRAAATAPHLPPLLHGLLLAAAAVAVLLQADPQADHHQEDLPGQAGAGDSVTACENMNMFIWNPSKG